MPNKKREIINPKEVFNAEGFTHAVLSTGSKTLYISGQLAWDEKFQLIGGDNLAAQTRKVYENIQSILEEAGASWSDVVKTTIYTTLPHENETIAQVKSEFMNGVPSPAETLIGVHSLAAPDLLVEIEAIAVLS